MNLYEAGCNNYVLYRKRTLLEKTPNIRPTKVLKSAATGSSMSQEPSMRAEHADLEEAIAKCFIGNLKNESCTIMIIHNST